jgi:hypothetical protein
MEHVTLTKNSPADISHVTHHKNLDITHVRTDEVAHVEEFDVEVGTRRTENMDGAEVSQIAQHLIEPELVDCFGRPLSSKGQALAVVRKQLGLADSARRPVFLAFFPPCTRWTSAAPLSACCITSAAAIPRERTFRSLLGRTCDLCVSASELLCVKAFSALRWPLHAP